MMVLRQHQRFRFVLELALVIVVGLYAAKDFLTADSQIILGGYESQWLTSSAYLASNTLRNDGYLTLWNPWLGQGEPAIESPFSFVLNPLSTAPSLIFGAEKGIRYSVVLYAIFAGIGGWLLAKVLRLNGLGRLFLALVCIGRGSMHAEISAGYFQLGVAQAYFPWVTAATLAIIRFRQRWSVVLLAVILTLLFWAGNIYYVLPVLIFVAILALAFLFKGKTHLDRLLLRRLLLALVLTVGLVSATLLPMFAHQGYIGGHPNEDPATAYEDPAVSLVQFFTPERFYMLNVWHETYFSFVLPIWFALLIFVILPIVVPQIQRSADTPLHLRVYIAGIFIIVLFFTWATKTNPIITWVYAYLPLIGQWRVLSRMLTVSAFWIGVLAAMRLDALWRALVVDQRLNRWLKPHFGRLVSRLHLMIALVLLVSSTAAVVSLVESWFQFDSVGRKDPVTLTCIDWLRQTHPSASLSVFGNDYYEIAVYIDDQVRFTHISADFHPLGMMPTIYPYDLRDNPPQYGRLSTDTLYMPPYDDTLRSNPPEYLIALNNAERRYWLDRGYAFVTDSPLTSDNTPCLLRNSNTLSYAFTMPLDGLRTAGFPLSPGLTTPVGLMNRRADHIGLIVNGDADQVKVLVVQEVAWPGWRVEVDGATAHLESVGQLIGVVLPVGETAHQILFVYDPPLLKLGGLITLMTAAFCALYLLNAERWISWQRTE